MNNPSFDQVSNNAHTQSLTGKQISYLRGLAHHRKVVVIVGNEGTSDSVVAEINGALNHLELIKIKLPPAKKVEQQKLLEQICSKTQASKIQLIGRIGVIYRPAETPNVQLPAI